MKVGMLVLRNFIEGDITKFPKPIPIAKGPFWERLLAVPEKKLDVADRAWSCTSKHAQEGRGLIWQAAIRSPPIPAY